MDAFPDARAAFVCAARPSARDAAPSPPPPRPHPAAGTVAARLGPWHVAVSHVGPVAVARDPAGPVTLLLAGAVYNRRGPEELLAGYRLHGEAFARDLDGSFAILVLDEAREAALIVTDRLNSQRVFACADGDTLLASNAPELLPLAGRPLDPLGVASYLVNGVVHNGRTLYRGVAALGRAAVHRLGPAGWAATEYWRYEFTGARRGAPPARLRAELADLLVAGVEARLAAGEHPFLSLSAGYDSRCILGIMGRRRSPGAVSCVSYVLGQEQPHHDAAIARQMAALYGFPHRVIQSYGGDPASLIAGNATLGAGTVHFCEELDAWRALAPALAAAPRPALFVGDECFGWNDAALHSPADVLASVSIFGFERLPWLRPLLGPGPFDALAEGWAAELRAIYERAPAGADLHDRKDYLYLDQRLQNVILPWRAQVVARLAPVRNPFLDRRVLDFMQGLPSELRRGKRLYRETVAELFPELAGFPNGVPGYEPEWDGEIARHRAALGALAAGGPSPLDDLIPPGLLPRLLADHAAAQRPAAAMGARALRLGARAARKGAAMLGLAAAPPPRPPLPRHLLIKRLLTLRLTLRHAGRREAAPAP